MHPSRIQAIDHVHIEAPPGLDDDFRWFYGEVGGLDEVRCDEADGPWLRFKSARIELWIHMKDEPRIVSSARRVALAVRSLVEAVERLEERPLPVQRLSGIVVTDRRIGTLDPGGKPRGVQAGVALCAVLEVGWARRLGAFLENRKKVGDKGLRSVYSTITLYGLEGLVAVCSSAS